jgi:hypothetical protein
MQTEGEAAMSVLGAAQEVVDETIGQWRKRHLLTWNQFEKIQGMLNSPSKGVTKQDVLRYEILCKAVLGYGIQYNNVDRKFVEEYVQGK